MIIRKQISCFAKKLWLRTEQIEEPCSELKTYFGAFQNITPETLQNWIVEMAEIVQNI